MLLNETEYDAASDTFAFFNSIWDVRLFIYAERINAMGRDLLELATGMNKAALTGINNFTETLGGTLLVEPEIGVGETETTSEIDVVAEVAGPPDIQQRMLVATVVNSVVSIYVRLESQTLTTEALRNLWRSLRASLFLAEPVGLNDRR